MLGKFLIIIFVNKFEWMMADTNGNNIHTESSRSEYSVTVLQSNIGQRTSNVSTISNNSKYELGLSN